MEPRDYVTRRIRFRSISGTSRTFMLEPAAISLPMPCGRSPNQPQPRLEHPISLEAWPECG